MADQEEIRGDKDSLERQLIKSRRWNEALGSAAAALFTILVIGAFAVHDSAKTARAEAQKEMEPLRARLDECRLDRPARVVQRCIGSKCEDVYESLLGEIDQCRTALKEATERLQTCPTFPGPDAIGLIAYTERTDPMDPAVRNLRAHLSFRVYGKWYDVGYGLNNPMQFIFTQPIDTWPFDEMWGDYEESGPEGHEWEFAYRSYKAALDPRTNNWTGGYGTIDLPDMLPMGDLNHPQRPTIRWNLESHFMWSDTTIHRYHTAERMSDDPNCATSDFGCDLGPDESSPLQDVPHYVYRALWLPLDWPTQAEAPNICRCAECPECDAAKEYHLLGCDRGRDAGP